MLREVNYNIVMPTVYGDVILNRNDTWQTIPLMNTGQSFSHADIAFFCDVAKMLGEGTVFMDVGSNVGFYSLALGRTLKPLNGEVIAIEGQRIIAYMLMGSVALNSMENVKVHNWVLGKEPGQMFIPQYDYNKRGSFGSIEFKTTATDVEQERQPDNPKEVVPMFSLDSLNLDRLDIIKIDAEGMEQDILDGGINTFKKFKPIVWIEWLKSDYWKLVEYFANLGYNVYEHGTDMFCIKAEQFPELQKQIDFWLKLHIQKPLIKVAFMGNGIGDICMGLGTAHALHDAGYRVFITAQTRFHDLLRSCPYVWEVSETDRAGEIWTCAWNQLQNRHQVDEHTSMCGLDPATIPADSKSIVITVPQELTDKYVAQYPTKDRIIIHPSGSVPPSRMWPKEYWQELVNRFNEVGIEVMVSGSTSLPWQEDTALFKLEGVVEAINLPLLETIALYNRCKVLVSVDSAPVQFAASTECGIVGLYSVMKPEHRLPFRHGELGWNAVGITTPCQHAGCYTKMVKDRNFGWADNVKDRAFESENSMSLMIYEWCVNEEEPTFCMKAITVDEVFSKTMELYNRQE